MVIYSLFVLYDKNHFACDSLLHIYVIHLSDISMILLFTEASYPLPLSTSHCPFPLFPSPPNVSNSITIFLQLSLYFPLFQPVSLLQGIFQDLTLLFTLPSGVSLSFFLACNLTPTLMGDSSPQTSFVLIKIIAFFSSISFLVIFLFIFF